MKICISKITFLARQLLYFSAIAASGLLMSSPGYADETCQSPYMAKIVAGGLCLCLDIRYGGCR